MGDVAVVLVVLVGWRCYDADTCIFNDLTRCAILKQIESTILLYLRVFDFTFPSKLLYTFSVGKVLFRTSK